MYHQTHKAGYYRSHNHVHSSLNTINYLHKPPFDISMQLQRRCTLVIVVLNLYNYNSGNKTFKF